ncbi:hypothetical protein SNOG_16488 [Parastagonospora nodorum SN15]|uniref:Uncharacterized protein n=1 Tax=Phaeosphaeria nodorum (strain SN15 / ATCC MYA-4574 / FGSC 10173) TaxID=321614 RepID=Q0TVH6_PHANO|nr:hypothetical protein SNOG_16488 [Parastagonospora nodorum SN15]EAT76186.1 hypothetical protein SNOG_16488 [Parastagonospora nodorum SN15]
MYPMRLCTATLLQGHLPRTSLTSTKSSLVITVNLSSITFIAL